ncbi:MAG: hypothetical protein WC294_06440 [Methanoregula sp.]|jgi:uncharacterized protein YoxC
MKLGSLVVEFLSDTSGFKKGINEVDSGLEKTEAKTKSTTAATSSLKSEYLLLASAATAVGYVVYETVQKYGAAANQLRDLSYNTGLTTTELQRIKYAAVLAGTSFEAVTPAITKLTTSMDEANDSTSATSKAFARLGVDPSGKTPAQVFEETSKALVEMEDKTKRNAIAADIYGRNWKEYLPFMETYVKNSEKIRNAPAFTQHEISNMQEMKTTWDETASAADTYFGKVVSGLRDLEKWQARLSPLFWILGGNKTDTSTKKSLAGSDIGSPTAVTSAVDPFASLTVKQAEIKNLTDYTIPALEKKLNELQKSGTAKEIADASLELIQAKNNLSTLISEKSEEEKTRIGLLTDAYSDYSSAIEKVKNNKQSLADLEDETTANLADAGTDVAAARQVMKAYNKSKLSLSKEYASDVYDVETAAGTFNSLSKGIDPAAVKGTSQYIEAQAPAQATKGNIVISGDIYLNGDKSFERYLSGLRTSMGVPNQ